jgi:hypothetical protein
LGRVKMSRLKPGPITKAKTTAGPKAWSCHKGKNNHKGKKR